MKEKREAENGAACGIQHLNETQSPLLSSSFTTQGQLSPKAVSKPITIPLPERRIKS